MIMIIFRYTSLLFHFVFSKSSSMKCVHPLPSEMQLILLAIIVFQVTKSSQVSFSLVKVIPIWSRVFRTFWGFVILAQTEKSPSQERLLNFYQQFKSSQESLQQNMDRFIESAKDSPPQSLQTISKKIYKSATELVFLGNWKSACRADLNCDFRRRDLESARIARARRSREQARLVVKSAGGDVNYCAVASRQGGAVLARNKRAPDCGGLDSRALRACSLSQTLYLRCHQCFLVPFWSPKSQKDKKITTTKPCLSVCSHRNFWLTSTLSILYLNTFPVTLAAKVTKKLFLTLAQMADKSEAKNAQRKFSNIFFVIFPQELKAPKNFLQ